MDTGRGRKAPIGSQPDTSQRMPYATHASKGPNGTVPQQPLVSCSYTGQPAHVWQAEPGGEATCLFPHLVPHRLCSTGASDTRCRIPFPATRSKRASADQHRLCRAAGPWGGNAPGAKSVAGTAHPRRVQGVSGIIHTYYSYHYFSCYYDVVLFRGRRNRSPPRVIVIVIVIIIIIVIIMNGTAHPLASLRAASQTNW